MPLAFLLISRSTPKRTYRSLSSSQSLLHQRHKPAIRHSRRKIRRVRPARACTAAAAAILRRRTLPRRLDCQKGLSPRRQCLARPSGSEREAQLQLRPDRAQRLGEVTLTREPAANLFACGNEDLDLRLVRPPRILLVKAEIVCRPLILIVELFYYLTSR